MDLLERVRHSLRDRYDLERELGGGGMSVVFLAQDLKHGRQVAVKVLRPELAGSLATDRFLQEIRISAGLQHPHILQTLDSGEADGLPFCVLPYVEGETLRERLQREGPLEIDEVVRIVQDVADALDYAHERQIIHRDIKPSNILLSKGHTYVADFGVAKALAVAGEEHLTRSGHAVGTPAYMSPEQATGETHLDGRSDLYSLACTTFEMLAGEPPFTGPTGAAIIAKQVSQTPPSLRVVRGRTPWGMEQAVEQALAKIPADRFPTAERFAQALSTGREAKDRPSGLFPASWKPGWARTALVSGVILLLLAVMLWPREPLPPAAADHRLAILPFQNPGGEEDLGLFADWLTKELIDIFSEIQRASGVYVFSDAAVRESESHGRPRGEIGRDLGASLAVDGSVFRSGDSVVVQISLVRPETGLQVWPGEVKERLAGAWELGLVERVAGELAEQLRRRVGAVIREGEIKLGTADPDAYQALLAANNRFRRTRARLFRPQSGDVLAGLEQAVGLYEDVIDLDPGWVEPYLQIGEVAYYRSVFLSEMQGPSDPEGALEALDQGLDALARALSRDPDNPKAMTKKGKLLFRRGSITSDALESREALMAAEESLEAALDRDPYFAEAFGTLSNVNMVRGEYEDARINGESGLERDAFLDKVIEVRGTLAVALLNLGEEEEATSRCREIQQRSVSYAGFDCELEVMAWGREIRPDPDRAAALKDTILSLGSGDPQTSFRPRILFEMAGVYGRAGLREKALAELEEARGCCPEDLLLWQEAAAELQLGNYARAVTILQSLLEQNPARGPEFLRRRVFDPLADDPGFQALVSEAFPGEPS